MLISWRVFACSTVCACMHYINSRFKDLTIQANSFDQVSAWTIFSPLTLPSQPGSTFLSPALGSLPNPGTATALWNLEGSFTCTAARVSEVNRILCHRFEQDRVVHTRGDGFQISRQLICVDFVTDGMVYA